jgi:hypothetical protein
MASRYSFRQRVPISYAEGVHLVTQISDDDDDSDAQVVFTERNLEILPGDESDFEENRQKLRKRDLKKVTSHLSFTPLTFNVNS